jgi:hypothetical protein
VLKFVAPASAGAIEADVEEEDHCDGLMGEVGVLAQGDLDCGAAVLAVVDDELRAERYIELPH